MKNINDKSSSIQMRYFIKKIRNPNYQSDINENVDSEKNSIKYLLKKLRENNILNKATNIDQKNEEDKFLSNFKDLSIHVDFIDLEIYNDFVFWGGTINGIIQFVYKVTKDKTSSGVEFNYLDGFNPDDEENEEIINRIENYYDSFFRYWNNNLMQK